jgi:hypothetical protein
VVEAYQLDKEKGFQASNATQGLNDNACLRIIKTKNTEHLEEDNTLKITLVYNQSMLADILNNSDHFNQFKLNRYTITYNHISDSLFNDFVKEICLDYQKCQRFKLNGKVLEVEINVKGQNENTGGYTKDTKNINEVFKFTC